MSFADWLHATRLRFEEEPLRQALIGSVNELYTGVWRRLGQYVNYGSSIWDDDWEVLVIADACRYDLFQDVEGEYPWLAPAEPRYSVASMSAEFMEKEFGDQVPDENIGLVTANPLSRFSNLDRFSHVDEVWKDDWDDEWGNARPRPVTDRAIHAWRTEDLDRLVVWFMQPHAPFVDSSKGALENIRGEWGIQNLSEKPDNVWNGVRDGRYDADEVWSEYRDTLRYVLDHIGLLRRSMDTETMVVTSDHANLIGECWLYGHPRDVPHPTLKRVPWSDLGTTDDTGTYDPDVDSAESRSESETSVEDRLEDLGYL